MNHTISLVTKVAAVDGVAAAVGACCPKGTPKWLRIQVSPHLCRRNEKTTLVDRR